MAATAEMTAMAMAELSATVTMAATALREGTAGTAAMAATAHNEGGGRDGSDGRVAAATTAVTAATAAAAMATVAEMAVTAASEGVQAVSERWQLLWWQQGDCRNGDTKRWQQWRQEMVAAMEAATGSADGNNGSSKEK